MTDPRARALPDGRLLLSGRGGATWLQREDGTWRHLRLPVRGEGGRADGGYVEGTEQGLFAFGGGDHELYRSDNSGSSWRVVDR